MNNNSIEPEYAKLVSYIRNGLEEQCHYGLIVHLNKSGIINKIGNDNDYKFYHRSCMKPLQISPLIDYNIDKEFGITDEELAVCAASHTGELKHQEKVLSILKKIGCSENDLLCLPHEPLSKKEAERLLLNNIKPSAVHNNCSGKHAAMLAICRHFDFDILNYNNLNHPLTKLITDKICDLCEVSKNDILISKDGCGLPVIATTLGALGKGFLNLYTNNKYSRLINAVKKYPYLAGGEGRLDSEIMNAGKNLISKVGACGLCVVVNIEKEEAIVFKIADSNMEARSFAVINTIIERKWLKQTDVHNSPVSILYPKYILTQFGESVGKITMRTF